MVYFESGNYRGFLKRPGVSILVLMDGVLRVDWPARRPARKESFNPCSNGWCTSRTPGLGRGGGKEAFQSLF